MAEILQHGFDHMSPLAQSVANAVQQASPYGTCFTCLAALQGVHEHDVRAAALVLIVRAGLELVRRACRSCGRTDDVLVSRKAA